MSIFFLIYLTLFRYCLALFQLRVGSEALLACISELSVSREFDRYVLPSVYFCFSLNLSISHVIAVLNAKLSFKGEVCNFRGAFITKRNCKNNDWFQSVPHFWSVSVFIYAS